MELKRLKNFQILLALTILAAVSFQPQKASHDVALYLQCGNLLLSGELPYVDIMDTNPPMIMYLNVIPAYLASLTHVSVIYLFLLLVFGLLVFSAVSLKRLLLRSPLAVNLLLVETIVIFWIAYSLFCRWINDFGQREHLFTLFYLPFFLLRWSRYEGGAVTRKEALLLGSTAGVMACLKPYFLLVAAAPEIYWLLSKRKIGNIFKPETFVFSGAVVLYTLHFLFLPPAVKEAFFGVLIPFLRDHYRVYSLPSLPSIFTLGFPMNITYIIVSCIGLLALADNDSAVKSILRPLGIVTLAGMFIHFYQGTGWVYHILPALAGAFMIAGIKAEKFLVGMLREAVTTEEKDAFVGAFLAKPLRVACLVFALVLTGLSLSRITPPNPFALSIARYTQKNDRVLFITADVPCPYPILTQMERKPGSRFLWFFHMAMLYEGVKYEGKLGHFPYDRLTPKSEALSRKLLGDLEEDIHRLRPKLIYITKLYSYDVRLYAFSILEYLQNEHFIENNLQDYVRMDDVNNYETYVLKEDPATSNSRPYPK